MSTRRIVGFASILGSIVAAVCFVLESSYLGRLASFFLFWLFVFHIILAFRTTLTRRAARSTDYIYFSLTILTIFLASIAQQRERGQQYVAFITNAAFAGDEAQVLGLIDSGRALCDAPLKRTVATPIIGFDFKIELDRDTCAFLTQARSAIERQAYSEIAGMLPEASEGLAHFLFVEPWSITWQFTKAMFSPSTALSFGLAQVLKINVLAYSVAKMEGQKTPAGAHLTLTGSTEAALKYVLSSLWPFVLAFAVSLRITRVTADVTEWPV